MAAKQEVIRVAVVEDDPDVRNGLRLMIDRAADCTCVGTFGSAEEALAAAPGLGVDVVLMDIQLPGMSGIECIRAWKRLRPEVEIMMLTVFEDHDRIFKSLEAGATGYIIKQTSERDLIAAVRELRRGGSPMSSSIARRVVQAFCKPVPSDAYAAAATLSPRQREIVELLAKGRLYKEIASDLNISEETIRTHIHNAYRKLQVRTRTEAVMKLFGGPGRAHQA